MLADIAKGITSLQSQFVSQGAQLQSMQDNLPCQIHTALQETLDGFKDSVLEAVDTKLEAKLEEKITPIAAQHQQMEATVTKLAESVEALHIKVASLEAQQAQSVPVQVDDSDGSSSDGKPPPHKRGKHEPNHPSTHHPAPGNPASSNSQWSTFGPPHAQQHHQQAPTTPQHFNIGSPSPSGRPPVGAPAGWPASSAAPAPQHSHNPTRLWVSGYRQDVVRKLQEQHFALVQQAISEPFLRSSITPRYRNGAPSFPIDVDTPEHARSVLSALKDFKYQWKVPGGEGEVRSIRVHADASQPVRQMKKLLGIAWEALEAHMRTKQFWDDSRAMGANFHTGKLWYTDGESEAVVNLLKVKLDQNGTISIQFNFLNLDKVQFSREEATALEAKVQSALSEP